MTGAPRGGPVVALVAAHQEEETIASTVKALAALPALAEVVVVADGCTDRTAEEAAGAGARVLVAPHRLGKGGALEEALERGVSAAAYLLVDGDVAETAREAGSLLDEVLAGRLDLAIGRLPSQGGGGFGLVNGVAASLIRSLTGFEAESPLSGQRAITREALWGCRPLAGGFGVETAMTIDAVRLGFRVGEISVDVRHRPDGRSLRGFSHRSRQGLDIVRAVAPRALRVR